MCITIQNKRYRFPDVKYIFLLDVHLDRPVNTLIFVGIRCSTDIHRLARTYPACDELGNLHLDRPENTQMFADILCSTVAAPKQPLSFLFS